MSDTHHKNSTDISGGRQAWFVWSLAALTFGYAFFHRVTPNVMVSDLMSEFAIGGAMLGTLSALYFYPYVLLQIPLGGLIDIVGTRYLLSSAIAVAAIGSVIFGMATTLEVAYLGRILIGIGSSVGFLGSLALVAKWFPVHRFSLLAGLTMLVGMLSGMLAQAPLAILVEWFGWRNSMWSLGVFGALLAAMILIFVRNAPPAKSAPHDKENKPKQERQSWSQMRTGLADAAGRLEVWKVALVAAAMSGPMLTIGGLWGTPYLMAAYDIKRPEAAFLMSLMLIGWAFGAPTSGWLSDRYRHRKAFLVAGCAMLTISMGLVVMLPNLPLWATVFLFVMAGISGSIMTTCFALVREVTPSQISGSVTGIVNSMTVASGALLQPLVGLLLDNFWDGTLLDGARAYGAVDYQWSFSIIFASSLVGLLVSLLLKEAPAE